MRHRKGNKKLSKTTDQRMAMLRSMVCALFKHDRIKTTLVRAKAVRREAEKMITLAKAKDLSSKRRIAAYIYDAAVAKNLWTKPERFANRSGGYTRIIHLGQRRGDATPMAMLELVDISA